MHVATVLWHQIAHLLVKTARLVQAVDGLSYNDTARNVLVRRPRKTRWRLAHHREVIAGF